MNTARIAAWNRRIEAQAADMRRRVKNAGMRPEKERELLDFINRFEVDARIGKSAAPAPSAP